MSQVPVKTNEAPAPVIETRRLRPWLYLYLPFGLMLTSMYFWEQQDDEWYQVYDFITLMFKGISTDFYEIKAHLRNLTIQSLLLPFYALAKLSFPYAYHLHFFAPRLVTFLLNLVAVYGVLSLYKTKNTATTKGYVLLAILLLFPANAVIAAGRTSFENFSMICFWTMVLMDQKASAKPRWYLGAGFFAVMTGIVRYPSGILGIAYMGTKLLSELREKRWAQVRFIALGLALGLIFGGLADFYWYGRPYESLWMYYQFNFATGLAEERFSSQGPEVYMSYIKDYFGLPKPVLQPLILLSLVGLLKGLKEFRPWAIAGLAFYLLQLIPSHKEGRFIFPLISIMTFAAIYGSEWVLSLLRLSWESIWRSRLVRLLFTAAIIFNLVEVYKNTRRQILDGRILSVHIEEQAQDDFCGVVLDRHYPAVFIPEKFQKDKKFIGYEIHIMDKNHELGYLFDHYDQSTPCKPDDKVLRVVAARRFPEEHLGCTPIKARNIWGKIQESNVFWVRKSKASPYYACPYGAISKYLRQPSGHHYHYKIPTLKSLPPLGLKGHEFIRFVDENLVF